MEMNSENTPSPSGLRVVAASQDVGPALSDAVFKASFHQSPEAMVLSRAADGVIVEVNQECLDLTGFTRAELLGRTMVDMGHWPDAQVPELPLAALKMGGRIHDADIMLRMNAVVLEVQGETYSLFYLSDTSSEHQAREVMLAGEKGLERANEKLNRQVKLYEMTEAVARVGYWVDAQRDTGNGYFGAVKLQKNQLDAVTGRLPGVDVLQITAPGQRGLESKAFARREMPRQFLQHQSPGLNRRALRCKGRQSGSDQVGIDEHRAIGLVGQKFAGKGGFTRAVRPPSQFHLVAFDDGFLADPVQRGHAGSRRCACRVARGPFRQLGAWVLAPVWILDALTRA